MRSSSSDYLQTVLLTVLRKGKTFLIKWARKLLTLLGGLSLYASTGFINTRITFDANQAQ